MSTYAQIWMLARNCFWINECLANELLCTFLVVLDNSARWVLCTFLFLLNNTATVQDEDVLQVARQFNHVFTEQKKFNHVFRLNGLEYKQVQKNKYPTNPIKDTFSTSSSFVEWIQYVERLDSNSALGERRLADSL